ncbi:MAG: hypothetical protein KF729_30600 [Sandaracinaceae bacterium]|nr:hypothetical protein [Sandaracinaceae bacterium]
MLRSIPTFGAALLLFTLGCSANHTRGDDDAGRPPASDAGRASVDAGRDPEPIPTPSDACARAAAGEPDVACDPATFEPCHRPVAGVRCCSISFACRGGRVVGEAGFCTDDCAQGCPLITEAFDCAATGCEWFTGGCGPAPEGVIEGPRCLWPRGEACATDADCDPSAGTRCVAFWVDPCAGSTCDACGGEARFCSSWVTPD